MAGRKTRLGKMGLWLTAAAAVGLLGFLFIYQMIGKTPRELFDYVEERLLGHPKLQAVALPVIWEIRAYLNEPSLKERRALQFQIPPPPPLIVNTEYRTTSDALQPGQRLIRVGPQGDAATIAAAAKLARDGDIVEIPAGNYYGDVAIWKQKNLTIRGVGGHARLFADGKSAGGKAIWVFRNGDFTIENIDFIGAKVGDQNGAGIRFENGHLRVRHCLFYGNESGILISNKPTITATIENSEFAYNGTTSGLSHALYAGNIDALTMIGNFLHHSNTGHLIKSRARVSKILYNRITDEAGRASYEGNFPNGGKVLLLGNIIQQSRETENSTMVSYGEEGLTKQDNSIQLINNTLVNGHPHGGAFLRVAKGTQAMVSINNLYVGHGKIHSGIAPDSINDVYADWDIFEVPQRNDFTLNAKGLETARISNAPGASRSSTALPDRQYSHPMSTRPLSNGVTHSGALQPVSGTP
ncbi:MAG: right-handed parallel beta-helix repeat-containing protein [Pseudomonadota bacterium]